MKDKDVTYKDALVAEIEKFDEDGNLIPPETSKSTSGLSSAIRLRNSAAAGQGQYAKAGAHQDPEIIKGESNSAKATESKTLERDIQESIALKEQELKRIQDEEVKRVQDESLKRQREQLIEQQKREVKETNILFKSLVVITSLPIIIAAGIVKVSAKGTFATAKIAGKGAVLLGGASMNLTGKGATKTSEMVAHLREKVKESNIDRVIRNSPNSLSDSSLLSATSISPVSILSRGNVTDKGISPTFWKKYESLKAKNPLEASESGITKVDKAFSKLENALKDDEASKDSLFSYTRKLNALAESMPQDVANSSIGKNLMDTLKRAKGLLFNNFGLDVQKTAHAHESAHESVHASESQSKQQQFRQS